MTKKIKMQSSALQSKQKPKASSACFMAVNVTKKIIDTLKENYEFRLNIGNQKTEFRVKGETKYKNLTDKELNSLKVELNLMGIQCSKDNLITIIDSNQWPDYDPYKEFLNNLPEWDGHDYIEDLAATVKTDDDKYFAWCLRKWLVALVGSLADDKTVNHIAIILCGKQGIGKSAWFQNLIPPELRGYVSSGFLNPKDKETLVQLSELIVYIMDEVENLKPHNVEAIKEIMTKPSMYLRRAYKRLSDYYIRRCSFCGTANGINILHDITGNRRFLCHNVISIDYELKNLNHQQLYSQAYQLFRTRFQYWIDQNEQASVEIQNSRFRNVSMDEELLMSCYEPCQDGDEGSKRMQAHEILNELQRKSSYIKISSVNIGKLLSAKGFMNIKSKGISKWIVKEKSPVGMKANPSAEV